MDRSEKCKNYCFLKTNEKKQAHDILNKLKKLSFFTIQTLLLNKDFTEQLFSEKTNEIDGK